ncbi:hypothetical protein ACLB1Q_05155 [Escherichia coli]
MPEDIYSHIIFTIIEALASNIPWSVTFGVSFNNGTPFTHCVTPEGDYGAFQQGMVSGGTKYVVDGNGSP